MIKFFRHIRKSLLMENKKGKYFKYAVGEIVLVVIGILIALQINNWNEIRKLNLEETKALENIQRDFLKNRELLSIVMNNTQTVLDAGLEILSHTGNKIKPTKEAIFNTWLNDMFNSEPYYPHNGFLDDLLSSGKLGIFKNVELRNLLSSWKPKVDVLGEKFTTLNQNEDKFNTFILEHASWLNADQVDTKARNIRFPISGFDIDNRNLLNTLFFENLVENVVIRADSYYSFQTETLKLLNEIVVILENEIANKND
tara:strand:- start:117208 stop:117975 length:768 start_codon:yes stop_codon:yes gene_type:complete